MSDAIYTELRQFRTARAGIGLLSALFLFASLGTAHAQTPDQVGQWGSVLDWGIQGKHMVVQPNGKVLVWATGDNARVWDPATGNFQLTPATFGDLHCGAQATLADGRTIALGGVQVTPHVGTKVTGLFDPFSNTWTQGTPMTYARWYGTATTLADGRVLVSSGDDQNTNRVMLPEIFDPILNTWTVLSGASKDLGLYPYMYVLPNGKVFNAGTGKSTNFLSLAGTGSWTSGPTNSFGSSGYAECGAMYGPGKILRSGGGDPAITSTSVIDMNAATPVFRDVAPMAFPRRRHNVVVLADGTLLAVGGTRSADLENQAILAAEIWDPATEQWRTVASMTEARMYHSAAVLLPDGRVLSAGGEATGRVHAQIYSPPYLFKGVRPTISSSPAIASYGTTFSISTPNASSITSVAILRANAVTHAIDMNQRYVPLAFTVGTSSLTVTAPASGNLAPPGYYLLVIKTSTGIPSVAAWLRIGSSTGLSPGTITGKVTNAATGAALVGATVSYSGGSTTSNATGNYTLSNVSPGAIVVKAQAASFATTEQTVQVNAGATVTLNFALSPPGSVLGRVTDSSTGFAIVGATVTANGTSVLTNSTGNYAFTDLAAGQLLIDFSSTGYYSVERTLTIVSGGIANGDTALTPLDPRILGELRDLVSDQTIAGATVSYSGGTTTTDSIGRYAFTNVVPGTYAVTASASGYADFTEQAVVTVRAWTSLDFHLTPAGNGSQTFPAVADAQVKSTLPDTNYGTLTSLRARAANPDAYRSFLKFAVSGASGSILSAKLWLFVTDPSPTGGDVYYVGNTWTETGITWTNAPALTGAPIAQVGNAANGAWVSVDVTPVVSGNGTYAFGISSLSTNSVIYSSREGANPPVLVVDVGGQPVLPSISGFTPPSGPVGTQVTITGANFTGTTDVQFNNAHAMSFTVDSATQIRTVVPSGATSGPIAVKNAAGTALSAASFTVATGAPLESHFAPSDDAHVQTGSLTSNYGGISTLRAKHSSTDYKFYLKFAVSGLAGPVQSAKLRLFVTDPSSSGGSLYGVSNDLLGTTTPWGEYALNWNNAPALSGSPTSSLAAVATGTWVEFDVTPLVTGNGTLSFGVSSAVSDSVYYSSKEGTNPPELVVQSAP